MTEKQQENKAIAETILQQLGGRKFVAMTGAKDFVIGERQVSFSLSSKPGFVKNGINHVIIKLNWQDTYDLEFGRKRNVHYVDLIKSKGIYFDMLQEVFTNHTGLDTHL